MELAARQPGDQFPPEYSMKSHAPRLQSMSKRLVSSSWAPRKRRQISRPPHLHRGHGKDRPARLCPLHAPDLHLHLSHPLSACVCKTSDTRENWKLPVLVESRSFISMGHCNTQCQHMTDQLLDMHDAGSSTKGRESATQPPTTGGPNYPAACHSKITRLTHKLHTYCQAEHISSLPGEGSSQAPAQELISLDRPCPAIYLASNIRAGLDNHQKWLILLNACEPL